MDTSGKAPTRVLIIIRDSSRHWSKTDKEVIEAALLLISQQALGPKDYTFTANDYKFIAKEMWGTVTFFIFDLFNDVYDPNTAHKDGENDLPVITVRFSNRKETALHEGQTFRTTINQRLRQLHDDEGYESKPPFFVDHTNGNVPTYGKPRNTVCYSSSPLSSSSSASVEL